jgi:hypothetical protein
MIILVMIIITMVIIEIKENAENGPGFRAGLN